MARMANDLNIIICILCVNRPPALYLLIEKNPTRKTGHRMGFFIFGKAHTGPLYGFLPLADKEQVV